MPEWRNVGVGLDSCIKNGMQLNHKCDFAGVVAAAIPSHKIAAVRQWHSPTPCNNIDICCYSQLRSLLVNSPPGTPWAPYFMKDLFCGILQGKGEGEPDAGDDGASSPGRGMYSRPEDATAEEQIIATDEGEETAGITEAFLPGGLGYTGGGSGIGTAKEKTSRPIIQEL